MVECEEIESLKNPPSSDEILTRDDCQTIIENKFGNDHEILSYEIIPLDRVNGYLGIYHKLSIKMRDSEETINCFVKSVPKNIASKNIVNEARCFFKELFIYQTLVPEMQKFGLNIINECLPACYFQKSGQLAVFDDLSIQNYKSLQAQKSYDFLLLSMTMKTLAKFHASTIIFEEKKSEQLKREYRLGDEYPNHLHEIYFSEESHSGALLFQSGIRSIPEIINLFPELKTQQNSKNFENSWPQLKDTFFQVVKPSRKFRNVVNHGDLWTNNIMVKFDGQKAIDCAFVDYQCTRYCPPAHDFLSALYLTTDRENRIRLEEEMKKIYWQAFSEILLFYGYKSDDILKFDEFLESVEYIRPQMVLLAPMYKSFTMGTSEEISSFLVDEEATNRAFFGDRKEYLKMICEKSADSRKHLRECVLDLYSLCDSMSS